MFVIHMVPIWQFSYRNVLRYFEENDPKVSQSNIPKLRKKGVASTQAPMREKQISGSGPTSTPLA